MLHSLVKYIFGVAVSDILVEYYASIPLLLAESL